MFERFTYFISNQETRSIRPWSVKCNPHHMKCFLSEAAKTMVRMALPPRRQLGHPAQEKEETICEVF